MTGRGRRLAWHLAGSLLMLIAGPAVIGIGGGILGQKFASLFFSDPDSDHSYRSLAIKLMLENAELREMAAKSSVYRSMLNYTRVPGVSAVAGRVVYRSEGLIRGDLIINAGWEDGVYPGAVCITASGLVGVVSESPEKTATVKPITNPAINVSCITAQSGALGLLSSDSDGRLKLTNVDSSSRPEPGETVLTSRFGGVYPEGIVVGSISSVERDESGYYLTLAVESAVDFDTIDEVLILVTEE
ncbi:hypothetical protein CSA37_08150 [Candidatus Fermentibacteria bacterium]|nr:MAG: hypothetical protein CSA37_08150 [Candidatus Fermentibacteria bacterium]